MSKWLSRVTGFWSGVLGQGSKGWNTKTTTKTHPHPVDGGEITRYDHKGNAKLKIFTWSWGNDRNNGSEKESLLVKMTNDKKKKKRTLQILAKVVILLLVAHFGKQLVLKEVLASIGKWPPSKRKWTWGRESFRLILSNNNHNQTSFHGAWDDITCPDACSCCFSGSTLIQ